MMARSAVRGMGRGVLVRKPAAPDAGSGVVITQVIPASGDSIGGKPVTIVGSGFTGLTAGLMGASALTSFTVVNDTTITALTPAGTAGLTSVTLSGVTRSNCYVYRGGTYARPSLTRNNPVDVYVDAAAGGGGDGSSGSPYTLAEAKAALANGQRLYLKGDFGAGSFIPFTGKGSATDGIIVTRWPGEASQPILRGGPAPNDYDALFIDTGNYIVVEDLEVNRTGSSSTAVGGRGGDYCQIVNCTITDGHIKLINGSSNWYIKGNTIVGEAGAYSSNTGDGIWVQNGSNNNVIVQNTVGNCGHSGVTISHQDGSVESTCDDNVFAYNTITNTYSSSMILNGKANRTIVECNDFMDAGTDAGTTAASKDGLQLQGTNNIVRYNRIWNAKVNGISLQAYNLLAMDQPCTGNHVHNNTIFGCGSRPIHMTAKITPETYNINNTIEGNLAWANHTGGESEGGGGFYSGSYYPIWMYTDTAGVIYNASSVGGNIVRNNLLARTTSADQWFILVRVPGDGGNITHSLAQAEAAWAGWANNLTGVDPGLQDTAADKFWLDADASAAVDAGYATAGVVYLGSAPDCGAYERA